MDPAGPGVGVNRRTLVAVALLLVVEALALWGLLVFLLSGSAQARDLGVVGPVYPIIEPDLLQEITLKLREKERSGQLAEMQVQAQRRAQARIHNPPPVEGLHKAQANRSWRFDPSVRFDEPVLDGQGRIVVPAGATANPLAVVRLSQTLLFFDGRDPAQVDRVRAEIAATQGPVTAILVGGSPLALAQAWQRPVYFDQAGALVQRLGIRAVPARVTQDGRALLIQEFTAP
jgi:conjugal transfer pilus assembly protein TraW